MDRKVLSLALQLQPLKFNLASASCPVNQPNAYFSTSTDVMTFPNALGVRPEYEQALSPAPFTVSGLMYLADPQIELDPLSNSGDQTVGQKWTKFAGFAFDTISTYVVAPRGSKGARLLFTCLSGVSSRT